MFCHQLKIENYESFLFYFKQGIPGNPIFCYQNHTITSKLGYNQPLFKRYYSGLVGIGFDFIKYKKKWIRTNVNLQKQKNWIESIIDPRKKNVLIPAWSRQEGRIQRASIATSFQLSTILIYLTLKLLIMEVWMLFDILKYKNTKTKCTVCIFRHAVGIK